MHDVEPDIRQAPRASLTRWYAHGVPIYLVTNAPRDVLWMIEGNWPDATIVARVEKPGGESAFVIFRLPDHR